MSRFAKVNCFGYINYKELVKKNVEVNLLPLREEICDLDLKDSTIMDLLDILKRCQKAIVEDIVFYEEHGDDRD